MSDPLRPELERLCGADLIKRVEALEEQQRARMMPRPASDEVHDGKRKPAEKK